MPVMVTTTQSGQSRQAEIGQKRPVTDPFRHTSGGPFGVLNARAEFWICRIDCASSLACQATGA